MERVAFLIEATGERIGCLLNPESVVVRRRAGLRARRSVGTAVTGAGLADDPLLFTGGGETELLLDLLFDVTIAGSTVQSQDVRDLTGALWRLAENAEVTDGYGRPPLVRFVWGKAWNFPAVVAAVAERLEHFSEAGAPRRSWLRMRLRRVGEPSAPPRAAVPAPLEAGEEIAPGLPAAEEPPMDLHEVVGTGPRPDEEPTAAPQYLGVLAERASGDARQWRLIAEENDIDDPLALAAGVVLRIPRGTS